LVVDLLEPSRVLLPEVNSCINWPSMGQVLVRMVSLVEDIRDKARVGIGGRPIHHPRIDEQLSEKER
jgi:hypothetical protein